MTEPTSTAADQGDGGRGLITGVAVMAASMCLMLLFWFLSPLHADPYVEATLDLKGSSEHGGQLFRINCAGCHGLTGQGLLGPNLNGISGRLSDRSLIHQISSGDTPPMPSFEMDPEAMADLLAHLHNLR